MSSPNRGYLQIRDGSGWRFVSEDNWDKKRQKMLCQHLGFARTTEKIISRRRFRSPSGLKLASGDLICYNRRSRVTSCCAHLVPSTINSTIALPYVECEYIELCTSGGGKEEWAGGCMKYISISGLRG